MALEAHGIDLGVCNFARNTSGSYDWSMLPLATETESTRYSDSVLLCDSSSYILEIENDIWSKSRHGFVDSASDYGGTRHTSLLVYDNPPGCRHDLNVGGGLRTEASDETET